MLNGLQKPYVIKKEILVVLKDQKIFKNLKLLLIKNLKKRKNSMKNMHINMLKDLQAQETLIILEEKEKIKEKM